MKKKLFILGLGHQKCATSWLYEYLSSNKQFSKGILKEYHVWDTLDNSIIRAQRNRNKNIPMILRKFKYLNLIEKLKNFKIILRGIKYLIFRKKIKKNPEYYYEYFASLYKDEKKITADITPSYSVLSEDRLRSIKENFTKRNIKVKVIILLRDPLERIKSAALMNFSKRYPNSAFKKSNDEKIKIYKEILKVNFQSDEYKIRGDYKNTIEKSEKVFNNEDIFIGFYESLFNPTEIKRLSNFLDIKMNYQFVNNKINDKRNDININTFDDEIRKTYGHIYKYCQKKFPILKVLWK